MTKITADPPDLPYTLLRAIDVQFLPSTDRVAAIARADMRIFSDGTIVPSPPQQLRVDLMAEAGRGTIRACSPLTICQAVWSREEPAIICTHGSRAWELVAPLIGGRLPRLDVAKLAMLIYPGLSAHDLDHLFESIKPEANTAWALDRLTQLQIRLLKVQVMICELYSKGPRLIHLAKIANAPDRSWIKECVQDLAGDAILQAAVDLSLLSLPPADDPRPQWDNPSSWLRLAAEELDYILGDPATTAEARAAARAEYMRREAVRKTAEVGHTLMRRRASPADGVHPTP